MIQGNSDRGQSNHSDREGIWPEKHAKLDGVAIRVLGR